MMLQNHDVDQVEQNENRYVIRGGKDGRERLRMLARVIKPGTTQLFQRIGIQYGWRCLDVGCGGGDVTMELAAFVGGTGHVLGIDIDPSIVEIAQREADEAGVTNVSFQCCGADSIHVDLCYDLIYCRFLLTHLSDPAAILNKLMQALKPSGILVVEDIDFAGHFCYPESAAFQRYIELYHRIVRKHGGNPNIGPRLPALLLDTNCIDVQVHIEQPAALSGETKLIAFLTWENIADELLQEGMSTRVEIRTIADELYSYAQNPRTLMSLPRIIQTWGYRPNS